MMQPPQNRQNNVQIMSQQLSVLIELQDTTARRMNLIQSALLGAMFAFFIASASVFLYLVTQTNPQGIPLIQYVLTSETSNIVLQSSPENLFAIVARFLVVFGLTWMPILVVAYVFSRLRD